MKLSKGSAMSKESLNVASTFVSDSLLSSDQGTFWYGDGSSYVGDWSEGFRHGHVSVARDW